MGAMFMEKIDSPWELSVVENAGEIPASEVQDSLAVKTAPLMTDIKSQLMLVPRTLSYTVGWKALVWKNKETGAFQDLTEEEYTAYVDGGIVSYTRGSSESNAKDEGAEGDSGSNPF
jgi:hypothetical protein